MAERQHRATFARDKRNGGYLVRVMGPHANRFAGKEVPVTLKNNTERKALLEDVVWTGKDDDTGKPVALYTHAPEPQEEQEVEF